MSGDDGRFLLLRRAPALLLKCGPAIQMGVEKGVAAKPHLTQKSMSTLRWTASAAALLNEAKSPRTLKFTF
jgi:hypothetical protein